MGDARIFESSHLARNYREHLQQFVNMPLVTGVDAAGNPVLEDVPPFILGDAAYRNTANFVTTYKFGECERTRFIALLNRRLGGARYHVENAFGILKGRFKILSTPLLSGSEDLPFTIHFIAALFVLHNFLIDSKDELPPEGINDGDHGAGTHGADDAEEDANVNQNVDAGATRDILLRHIQYLELQGVSEADEV